MGQYSKTVGSKAKESDQSTSDHSVKGGAPSEATPKNGKVYVLWLETPPMRGMAPVGFEDPEEALLHLKACLEKRMILRDISIQDPAAPEPTEDD